MASSAALQRVRGWVSLAADVACVVVLAGVAVLFYQARVGSAGATQSGPAVVERVGAEVRVADAEGSVEPLVGGEAESQLVFVFRSDCPACAAQKSDWLKVASAATRAGIAVRALTPEQLGPWAEAYFPTGQVEVVRMEDPAAALQGLGTAAVPTTLLLRGDGRVVLHNVGILSAGRVTELEGLLAGSTGGTE